LEVRVVQIFLIDPERHEQDNEKLDEDEDLCEPGNALQDRTIGFFASRNPCPIPRVQTRPHSDLERTNHMGSLCPMKEMTGYSVSHEDQDMWDNTLGGLSNAQYATESITPSV